MKNNVFEKVKFNCIGCGLCEGICPKKCINIHEVSNKGILPFVDIRKCSSCGICVDVCPTDLISKKENLNDVKEIFVGKSKNKEIIKNSSSGGIVSSIIIDLFDKEKIDAALVAFFDSQLNIYGDFITSKDEVMQHSGSFYHTSKQLLNIEKIKKYKSVLFVGLPCHNIAFEKFCQKFNINNVYVTISLACTIGRMKNGIKEYFKEKNLSCVFEKNVESYKSRYGLKRPGNIIVTLEDGKKITIDCFDYFISKDYFFIPDGCLNCRKLFGIQFSDISVGDNWGIDTGEKIAIFTANTKKGLQVIKENKLINVFNSNIEELKKSQPLGYPLKYFNRKRVNKQIRLLKYIYRRFSKYPLVKKMLYKLRRLLLWNIKNFARRK
ncbi:Coenzyme F420 hydrogenase/dehydrogenase, beta subunit C-terminal domain [Thermosipho atlanticus]|uniref:Coenzyme F420-reducing hydrogenase, beta subunit n=1 Tax=Thermosipho atlanticus DSM 15807 TaxID=1123380 RepID=A0A1M5RLT1_9BACT|nr:Coenzyme F420 hydrogenase/dehydrogenase, beta subunit C-terminal domain [Thermosipho atlanticus]SHH27161.1 Coenzyme F420-reducing hydrogenase, beta subunit [Thermosipho atlanticus DSM 15807]